MGFGTPLAPVMSRFAPAPSGRSPSFNWNAHAEGVGSSAHIPSTHHEGETSHDKASVREWARFRARFADTDGKLSQLDKIPIDRNLSN